MPTIDVTQGVLVVRIVYDGPAMSGKTSSLKSLAKSVQTQLQSGEERDGRTLYFDWMEYVGGLFEGRQIRCQIISVPGQLELAARRKQLLESADAVVCVLDTRRAELEHGLSWLGELVPWCRTEPPPVGVVVQANKRDAADAVPREDLRTRIDQIAPIAIVESVATTSDGIREAFVLAVRLALDRVRALSAEGRLSYRPPAVHDAASLLASLREGEVARSSPPPPMRMPSSSPPAYGEPAAAAPFVDGERVFSSDPALPGMIWPPVDGRALLYEASLYGLTPKRTKSGDWTCSVPGWRFHSRADAVYPDADQGRAALLSWARLHAAQASVLSSRRAVILADAGEGRTRLWQLVNVVPTLRELLDAALEQRETGAAVDGMLEVGALLARAHDRFARSLPCTLWSVGVVGAQVLFAGLVPMQDDPSDPLPLRSLLRREISPHLRRMRRARVDYGTMARLLSSPDAPQGSVHRELGVLAQELG